MTAQTDTIRSGYADMIDNSTPQTLASTLAEAADAARLDAETCQARPRICARRRPGSRTSPG